MGSKYPMPNIYVRRDKDDEGSSSTNASSSNSLFKGLLRRSSNPEKNSKKDNSDGTCDQEARLSSESYDTIDKAKEEAQAAGKERKD
ncbi:hypothetical protein NpPPO83_00000027 [Neofusicoccum parvum]|uniref:Uncharacterized protein n=1 Tax=Neofusicoccum parvum TaxID=310453 RepID=A0ACB5SFM9_9PEZI|nr:hypothetical protein NpPPO83_00000027 [Neofusicoccum parvum]